MEQKKIDKIEVTVHQARDLPVLDVLTKSTDPFVVLSLSGCLISMQTEVKKSTLNPVWEESFIFPFGRTISDNDIVNVKCFDKDHLKKDDKAGKIVIRLSEGEFQRKWIKLGGKSAKGGEICLSLRFHLP
eukprot:GEZU01030166.1.p1 GENE.GEZU01030166.1~~GEZU01030166.1.p1  ORF type:complete len:130 (-),score=29.30 GEZU01030166.1:210-599(-)